MAIDLLGGDVELLLEENGVMQSIQSVIGPASSYIDSVRVNIPLLKIFTVDVHLAPPLEQAIKLLKSGKIGIGFSKSDSGTGAIPIPLGSIGISKLGIAVNRMAVRLHYGGRSSSFFKAILMPPDIDISTDGVSITMKGVGMMFSSTKAQKQRTFKDQTKSKILQELIGDEVEIKIEDRKAIEDLDVQMNYDQSKSDWESALEVLESANCTGFYAGAKNPGNADSAQIFKIRSRHGTRTIQRIPTFVMYRQINPNKRVYPLLGLSTEVTNLTLPGAAWGKKISSNNREEKKTNDVKAGAGTMSESTNTTTSQDGSVAGGQNATQRGTKADVAGNVKPDDVGGAGLSVPGKFEVEKAKGLVHSFMDKTFQYSLQSIGVVDLLPGQMVNVAIADIDALTGAYDLYEVEHNVSSGGVETALKCARTGGLISALSQQFEKARPTSATSSAKTNTKIPQTSGVNIQ